MKKSHVYKFIFTLILLLSVPIIMNARHVISKGDKDLRCNRYIISKGEHQYTVRKKLKQCGVILSKGVMTTGDGNIKSEKWFVKINNRCYEMLFVNGVLRDISKSASCM